jgi:hypothetical protein
VTHVVTAPPKLRQFVSAQLIRLAHVRSPLLQSITLFIGQTHRRKTASTIHAQMVSEHRRSRRNWHYVDVTIPCRRSLKMRSFFVVSIALLMFASQSQLARGADPVPCSCLQELWADLPGPYDLYFSLNHIASCDDEAEEGLWYGAASVSALPQYCEYGNCEEYEPPQERSVSAFPGHGLELVGIKAWDVFRVALESATRKMPGLEVGTPTYHIIPIKNLPAMLKETRDMIVMAIPLNVHIKNSRFDGNTYYLCIQIDSAERVPITKAVFENSKLGRGSQLSVKYQVKSGEVRKGLVWLK